MESTDALIELRRVSRRYMPQTAALEQVDLSIDVGELIAIVGPSGSGKSTLLGVLGLLDAPDEGEVLIDGMPVDVEHDWQRSERRRADLGFVFQRSHLISELSALDNVVLGLRYWGWPENQIREQAMAALRDVGLGDRIHARARTLSGGEMQRVAIARTIARPARLWLADEPTGNLDSAQSGEIIELLAERATAQGAALIVVTHEPDIAAVLDRTITLLDGRIADDSGNRAPIGRPPPAERDVPVALTGRVANAARTLRFVVEGLRAQRRRAWAGVAATALAVTLTVTAAGLAQSAGSQVTDLFDARRARQVSADLLLSTSETSRWPIRIEELERYPGVEDATYWRRWPSTDMKNGLVAVTEAQLVEVHGAPFAATESTVEWAPNADQRLHPGEVVVGAQLAERLGLTQLDLRPELTIAGTTLRVVGIVDRSRSAEAAGSAFVVDAIGFDLGPPPKGAIYAETAPGAARGIADRLVDIVDPYRTAETTVTPVLRTDAYRGELEASVSTSLTVLAVVGSLAGLLAIVCVHVLGVAARQAEFGVRRAFGARRGDLVRLVVGESTAIGIAGAAIGMVTGFALVMAVTIVARWHPVFDWRLVGIGPIAAVMFGVVAGIAPAVVAGRVEPADAVRAT